MKKKILSLFLVVVFALSTSTGVFAKEYRAGVYAALDELSPEELALVLIEENIAGSYVGPLMDASGNPTESYGIANVFEIYTKDADELERSLRPYFGDGLNIREDPVSPDIVRIEVRMPLNNNEEIEKIANQAREHSTDPEGQLRFVNQYLCDLLTYDYDYYNGKKSQTNFTIEDILQNHLTVCTGYTKVVAGVCDCLCIPHVELRHNDPMYDYRDHIWNYVYVNGTWKHLDVTWNDTGGDINKYCLIDGIEKYGEHNWKALMTEEELEIAKQNAIYRVNGYATFKDDIAEMKKYIGPEVEKMFTYCKDNYGYIFNAPASAIYYAQELKLAPEDLFDGKYTTNVNRKDFCRMLMTTIERITGKTADEILLEKGASDKIIHFSDIENPEIEALAKLGVVSGVGDNRFDPDGQINLSQAAVLIERSAKKVLDIDTEIGDFKPPFEGLEEYGLAAKWPFAKRIIRSQFPNKAAALSFMLNFYVSQEK